MKQYRIHGLSVATTDTRGCCISVKIGKDRITSPGKNNNYTGHSRATRARLKMAEGSSWLLFIPVVMQPGKA